MKDRRLEDALKTLGKTVQEPRPEGALNLRHEADHIIDDTEKVGGKWDLAGALLKADSLTLTPEQISTVKEYIRTRHRKEVH